MSIPKETIEKITNGTVTVFGVVPDLRCCFMALREGTELVPRDEAVRNLDNLATIVAWAHDIRETLTGDTLAEIALAFELRGYVRPDKLPDGKGCTFQLAAVIPSEIASRFSNIMGEEHGVELPVLFPIEADRIDELRDRVLRGEVEPEKVLESLYHAATEWPNTAGLADAARRERAVILAAQGAVDGVVTASDAVGPINDADGVGAAVGDCDEPGNAPDESTIPDECRTNPMTKKAASLEYYGADEYTDKCHRVKKFGEAMDRGEIQFIQHSRQCFVFNRRQLEAGFRARQTESRGTTSA